MPRFFLKVIIASGLAGIWAGIAWSEIGPTFERKGKATKQVEALREDPRPLPIPGFGPGSRSKDGLKAADESR